MTLEYRLTAALARRGHQRLSQFIANALGLQCGAHHAGAVCGFYASDDLTVERLERYADQLDRARQTPSRTTHNTQEATHETRQEPTSRAQ